MLRAVVVAGHRRGAEQVDRAVGPDQPTAGQRRHGGQPDDEDGAGERCAGSADRTDHRRSPLGGRSVRTGPVGALDSAAVALVPATVPVGHSPIAGCRHRAPPPMMRECTTAACGRPSGPPPRSPWPSPLPRADRWPPPRPPAPRTSRPTTRAITRMPRWSPRSWRRRRRIRTSSRSARSARATRAGPSGWPRYRTTWPSTRTSRRSCSTGSTTPASTSRSSRRWPSCAG